MGGKTATSTQQVQIPPSVLAQYQSVNARAEQTADTPFQKYTGQLVAPVNQQQQAGIAGTNAAANEAQPYFGAATGQIQDAQAGTTGVNNLATGLAASSAQSVNPSDLNADAINKYMSPYLQDVLGSESALLNQNNQQQQAGQLGTAIQSGAFGGDRTGIAAANLAQQQQLANASIYSNILNTGYNNALSTAQQQQGVGLSAEQANRAARANAGAELAGIGSTAYGEGANTATTLAGLGAGAQTAGLQGAQAQLGAGTVEQQTQQAQDTALYNQFLQQQSYPFQVDQFLANIAEGTGALSGSTTTTRQPGGFFSDRRLKHDIKKIGKTYDGQHLYSYKMHGDPRTHIGLIAQNVEKKHPDAVGVAGGYKIVDYGKATEHAANRGHFYSGGVVPIRIAKASGGVGDYGDILEAQRQMYGSQEHRRDIPSQGVGGGHQLAVASGAPAPPPSGASNVNQTIGLVNNAHKLYKQFNKPTPSGSTTGVAPSAETAAAEGPPSSLATAGASDAGVTAAPAAAEVAAPAAEAAAPAAAEAAAPAAATAAGAIGTGAAVDAGAETAAALAAEYAAAYAAAAAVAAKRGGRIKRPGLAGGGIPYEGDGAGTPYQAADGTMEIPDEENTAKLQSPGPLKKQPTGLQTMMMLGDPNKQSDIAGSLFSNQALASGGVAGRRGYDDGGDVADDTVEDAPAPVVTERAPGVAGAAPKEKKWYKDPQNLVPLLSGIAAMGTAPTRSLGVALASGLGAGANQYLNTRTNTAENEQRGALTRGQNIRNEMEQTNLDMYKQALNDANRVRTPTSTLAPMEPPPSDPAQFPSYYQKQLQPNPTMTPAEQARLNAARYQGMYMHSTEPEKIAQTAVDQRVARQQFAAQQRAIVLHDGWYAVGRDPDNAFDKLQSLDRVTAAKIAQQTTDPAQRNAMAAQLAQAHANAIHPYTGDKYEDRSGALINSRTNRPPIGDAAQVLGPKDIATLKEDALQMVDVPQGDGTSVQMHKYQAAGTKSLDEYIGKIAGSAGRGVGLPAASAPNVTPQRPVAATSIPAQAAPQQGGATPALQTLVRDPELAKALVDPEYKLQQLPVRPGLKPSDAMIEQQKETVKARTDLLRDAQEAASSGGQALQYLTAARQIMHSKGKPVTGLYGKVVSEISRVWGGVDSSNYQEVAKYLANAALQGARASYGSKMTAGEVFLQKNELSPGVQMNDKAINDLVDANIKNVQYNIDSAHRVNAYLSPRYNNDPQKFADWNQTHFKREEVVNSANHPGQEKSGPQYPNAPPVGTRRGNRVFIGGDPASPDGWKVMAKP